MRSKEPSQLLRAVGVRCALLLPTLQTGRPGTTVEGSLPVALGLDGIEQVRLDHLLPHAFTPWLLPFCLGDKALPASERWSSWTRDHQLWKHVNEHVRDRRWPLLYSTRSVTWCSWTI
jgi:hypothetical protein